MRAAARAYMRISIAGPIGVGKTTLAKSLALELDVPFVPEPHTENPYFDDFYQNREEYAFRAQLTFMMHRIQHHISMRDDPQFRAGFVQERSAFEDRVFAERMLRQGDMDKRDFELYDGFYNVFARAHGEEVPDAIVVLDADVGTLLQRIRARARPGEDIDKAYLASFDEHYEAFVERMAKMTTVFRVNWNTERPQVSMQDTARKLLAEMEDACGSGKGVVVISV
jgi:deoxyadenosine/deoxycytidine kinase